MKWNRRDGYEVSRPISPINGYFKPFERPITEKAMDDKMFVNFWRSDAGALET